MRNKIDFLSTIRERVFILDGAMGTSVDTLGLTSKDFGGKDGCHENLVLIRPDSIEEIHRSFLEAGCMAVETDTFGGSRLKLQEYGLGDKVFEINQRAAEIAREVCDSFLDPKLVVGSLGPTGKLPSSSDPDLGRISFDTLADVFEEQASALIMGGADVLSIETSQDMLEAKAALIGCKRAVAQSSRPVPIMVLVTLDTNGRMLLGTDVGSALVTLEAMGLDVFGVNCSTGPEEMRDSIRFLSKHSRVPIACIPNMGIPENIGGAPVFPLEPGDFAREMAEFVGKFGVAVTGGCCGSTPAHLRALVEKLQSVSLPKREVTPLIAISSAMTYVTLEQEPAPLIVGERINAQGSRKMKQLLLDNDYDGIATMARSQAEKGAHALDVCVALSEREGEKERFLDLMKVLYQRVSAPILIDSTDSEVTNEAIKQYPGRVIVNSVNLENGEKKINEVGEAIRNFGACVIALTIDENGMAKTCEKKVAIAERIARILQDKYGMNPDRIIFDPLTFTLASGEEEYRSSAMETLAAIRRIKEKLPGSKTILGVSNISFGLKKTARAVLNSVFLYHALQKGLDLAIVNPGELKPYAIIPGTERNLADDLIFNRTPGALHSLSSFFEGTAREETPEQVKAFPNPEEEVRYKIIHRLPDNIEAILDRILEKTPAVEVINSVLLPAMKEVGDKFGRGELILPFVLQSAEVMKRSIRHVEKFLDKTDGYAKGRVVLATVQGDVHDIGKNLIKTILSNNGYEVKDLGKRVPVHTILEEAREFRADAVGLSALLVSTAKQMPVVAQEMFRAGLHIPILVGGAAVTPAFARRSAKLEEGFPYPGGFFYAKDAFEGLEILNRLTSPETQRETIEKNKMEIKHDIGKEIPPETKPKAKTARTRTALPTVEPPEPPFWGLKEIHDIDLDDIYPLMHLNSLYRLSWGIRNVEASEYQKLIKEKYEPLRLELQQEAKENGYLSPKAVYGYFPCKSSGDDVIIFDPEHRETVIAELHFPRQEKKKRLSIADYFRNDVFDVIPLQLVTTGPRASKIKDKLHESGEYTKSYYIHGLSVEAAEGLAEFLFRRIQAELELDPSRGKRYSHGYPACPDLSDNKTLLELLEAEKRLGVTVTEAFQFVPEQTTAAIVVHHPSAEYFSV